MKLSGSAKNLIDEVRLDVLSGLENFDPLTKAPTATRWILL